MTSNARKVALEEHFMTPEMEVYFAHTSVNVNPSFSEKALPSLRDFGDRRLDAMDRAGVARAVLSLSGPGVQAEPDAPKAVALARRCNDQLAEQVARRPDRYSGFAHLAMQDPAAATRELERCVRDLGFVGSMVNGQTGGVYLDDPRYEEFWATMAALSAPLYLHPANPVVRPAVYEGADALYGPMWGWTTETSAHALRLVTAGVFERHPRAQVILGHMGECLPFHVWRFDSRYPGANHAGYTLPRPPSFYIRRNIAITSSGVCDDAALICSLATMGEDRVLFSIDHPFEDGATSGAWADALPIDDAVKAKVLHRNAETLLGLSPA